jgi:DNA-binding response OmpR family regulator
MARQLTREPRVRHADALKSKKLANSHQKKTAAPTILLVEHHPVFLKLIKGILEDAKFKVLSAGSPKEAKRVEAGFKGTIDLLLSEVMMTPDLLGTKLAQALKKRRPHMRILLMSAYPGGELLILNYGWHFIGHPFMAQVLVARVKEVLHSKIAEQGTDRFDTRKERKKAA